MTERLLEILKAVRDEHEHCRQKVMVDGRCQRCRAIDAEIDALVRGGSAPATAVCPLAVRVGALVEKLVDDAGIHNHDWWQDDWKELRAAIVAAEAESAARIAQLRALRDEMQFEQLRSNLIVVSSVRKWIKRLDALITESTEKSA